jgi:hypothetical protein
MQKYRETGIHPEGRFPDAYLPRLPVTWRPAARNPRDGQRLDAAWALRNRTPLKTHRSVDFIVALLKETVTLTARKSAVCSQPTRIGMLLQTDPP